MDELSLGLIGPGAWGQNYIRTVEADPRARIAATATREWAAMIQKGGLDGVIIATPPDTHAEIAIAAIEAGLPVMVEKPLSLSAAEANRILACARQNDARVLVDHIHLFQPAWAELKRRAGALGALKSIHAVAGDHGPFREEVPVLWDWGPHDVALCLDLMGGQPVKASARCLKKVLGPEGVGESVSISLTFDGKAEAEIEIGNLTIPPRRYFKATYERGTLVMDTLVNRKLVAWGADGTTEAIPVDGALPLTVAVGRFIDMIGTPGSDITSLALAVNVTETLERCSESIGG